MQRIERGGRRGVVRLLGDKVASEAACHLDRRREHSHPCQERSTLRPRAAHVVLQGCLVRLCLRQSRSKPRRCRTFRVDAGVRRLPLLVHQLYQPRHQLKVWQPPPQQRHHRTLRGQRGVRTAAGRSSHTGRRICRGRSSRVLCCEQVTLRDEAVVPGRLDLRERRCSHHARKLVSSQAVVRPAGAACSGARRGRRLTRGPTGQLRRTGIATPLASGWRVGTIWTRRVHGVRSSGDSRAGGESIGIDGAGKTRRWPDVDVGVYGEHQLREELQREAEASVVQLRMQQRACRRSIPHVWRTELGAERGDVRPNMHSPRLSARPRRALRRESTNPCITSVGPKGLVGAGSKACLRVAPACG